MKVSVIENSEKVMRFDVSGTSYAVANALRRVAISSVNCFAIDSGQLLREHERDVRRVRRPQDRSRAHNDSKGLRGEGRGCVLAGRGGPATVYSKDLKSSDKGVKVANEAIPIIKLAEGQKVRADCKAVMGSGHRSAKFQRE